MNRYLETGEFVGVIIWDETVSLPPNRSRFAKIDKGLKPMVKEDSKAIERLVFVRVALYQNSGRVVAGINCLLAFSQRV